MSIPADLIEQARNTRVEDVLARHGVRLNGRGVARSGPCPICTGTDRFAIDIGKGVFNCRKCGAKGAGAIDLEMFLAGHSDFAAAVRTLAGGPISRPRPRQATQEKEPSGNGLGRPTVYDYRDEAGALLFQALRFEPPGQPKQFRQRAGPDQKKWSIEGVRIVLFRLPELIEDLALGHLVLIVEGEKDVETLRGLGVPATTNPMGAGKWRADFNEPFRGADVVVCGDNDKPGRDHVESVARIFMASPGCAFSILRNSGLASMRAATSRTGSPAAEGRSSGFTKLSMSCPTGSRRPTAPPRRRSRALKSSRRRPMAC